MYVIQALTQRVAAYLDSLGLYSISPDRWSGFFYKSECLDFFELGDMADASHPHLLLVMSVALAFSGVSQTAAMENDQHNSKGREGRWFCLLRREASWLQLGIVSCTGCYCALLWEMWLQDKDCRGSRSLSMSGRGGENAVKSHIVSCETPAAFSHQAKFYQPCLLDQAFLLLMPRKF